MARKRINYRLFRPAYRRDGKQRHVAKWHGEYRDLLGKRRRVALTTDRDESSRVLQALRDALQAAGSNSSIRLEDVPPLVRDRLYEDLRAVGHRFAETANPCQRWTDYIDAFETALRNGGLNRKRRPGKKYAQDTMRRIRETLDGCNVNTLADLDADRVCAYLEDRRRDGDLSLRTYNANIAAVKEFCGWWAGKVGVPNPMREAAQMQIAEDDRRLIRGVLTRAELDRLLVATLTGPKRGSMTGRERWLLYHVAVWTGLRRSECQTLRWGHIVLDTPRPFWRIRASDAKNRKATTLPLLPQLVGILKARRTEIGTCPPNTPVFPTFHRSTQVSVLLAADLEAAGIPQTDEHGETRDFHSLRHSFGMFLCRLNLHPKTVQKLMRHSSIQLTMDRYGDHFRQEDLAAALGKVDAWLRETGTC